LDGVRYPRPGEVVYRNIVLRQEEPRGSGLAEIARAELVWLQRGADELTLRVENARLRAENPRLAMTELGMFMQRSGALPFERINLTPPSCQVDLGRDDLHFALKDLAGEFLADPRAPALKLAYRVDGEGLGTRCEAILTRQRQSEPLTTSLTFKTAEGP